MDHGSFLHWLCPSSLVAPAGVSRPSLSRAAMCAGVCGTLQLIPVGWLPRHSGRCLLVVVSTRRLLNSEVGQCTSWSLSPHWPGASLPVVVPFNSGARDASLTLRIRRRFKTLPLGGAVARCLCRPRAYVHVTARRSFDLMICWTAAPLPLPFSPLGLFPEFVHWWTYLSLCEGPLPSPLLAFSLCVGFPPRPFPV